MSGVIIALQWPQQLIKLLDNLEKACWSYVQSLKWTLLLGVTRGRRDMARKTCEKDFTKM